MYIIYTYSLHTHIYIYSQLHAHVCEKCTIGHETLDPNHSMCIEQSFRIFGGDQLMIWVLQSGPSGEACMTQETGTMRKSTRPTWPGRTGTKRTWWLGGDFFGVKWGANWWFGTCILFFPYIGKNHPNWRTHIFQRGRSTTNQIEKIGLIHLVLIKLWSSVVRSTDFEGN